MGGGGLDLAVDHDRVGLVPRVVGLRPGLSLGIEPGLRPGGLRLDLGVRQAPDERGRLRGSLRRGRGRMSAPLLLL
eukprot:7832563-Lingulodinium_polyedra.AAC.1